MSNDQPSPAAPCFHAVVLAAGAGTRFGGSKLRADFEGRPLVCAAVAAACASPAQSVTLVTGADPQVAEAARCGCAVPLVVVQAMDWSDGVAASLKAGFSSAPSSAKGVFVFLGDMPRVPHGMAARLVEVLTGGASAAAPVCGGRRGHPVLVGPALMPAVAHLEGDKGLGDLLESLGAQLALVETEDDGVLFDVDTRDALPA